MDFYHKGNLPTATCRHFSGWETEEMRSHGYDVFGMLGPKQPAGRISSAQTPPPKSFEPGFDAWIKYYGFTAARKKPLRFFVSKRSSPMMLVLAEQIRRRARQMIIGANKPFPVTIQVRLNLGKPRLNIALISW